MDDGIERWWPALDAQTREWLTAHNGELVPMTVVDEISAAGGGSPAGASWADAVTAQGVRLADATVDWIEEAANGEH